ncbi:MSMEG_1061 family FMN-dependent PPOX-type flavoprotein [Actinomycetospora soli]|uniref:MSMEG_1061 family FMN-dependent PPOX-type flavoprotein n=1 Tax=Actinomycetospora soli TaxID=2893887 RepID=UPI0027E2492B|nr:MSMEG_1061 family FMN-dependent PPOX-type flavoprotein [Actinomycetospora soli]
MSLSAERLTLRYDDRVVVDGLSVRLPTGRITAIVGPNACGKSTLLRGLGRLIAPAAGRVLLDETDVRELPARELARRLGLLPQSPVAPEGITVADLVERGRSPHQGWFGGRTAADDAAVARAMTATGVAELADRPVDELSGGQRQRVWIAMVLAQDTPTLLLDEPTTYLDMAHAVEVLDLLVDRNLGEGTTVAVVLHDLDLAARYADHLVAMRDGAVVAEGTPAEVVTETTVERVFGIPARVVPDPVSGTPLVVPVGRHRVTPPAPVPDAGDALPDAGCGFASEADLRAVVDEPHPLAVAKVGDRVDATAAEFVAAAPLVVLASGRADGGLDVSPRGDRAGFVRVLDDGRRLALPERPGNRRIDTLRNVVERPGTGLLFLVPGVTHVLRVSGHARVVDDPAVLGLWDEPPPLALVVEVTDCFVHCSRALTRSAVWAEIEPAADVPGVKALAAAAMAGRGDA